MSTPNPSAILHSAFGFLHFDRLAILARDIKLSHSIFALPFALLATFLAAASAGRLPSVAEFTLIVLCMVLARTTAMTANRWLDADLDARNPRTAQRAIPSGRLSRRFAATITGVCALAFVVAAGGFWLVSRNPWPALLSPLALAWLCGYSLSKRFTWLCHLWLGAALALSPLAASLAIHPVYLRRPEPYLLALMVTCWVAGFDIIYALQDVTSDRAQGLFAMPARLGIEPALWVSRLLHVSALAALIGVHRLSPSLHEAFALGGGGVTLLLILEHALVWRSQTHYINTAFFTLNGLISVLLGALGIFDVVRATF